MGIVLGTAGHIDHGKTALIRALTGVDTDRLKEEKERGISIDLGFAYLDLPSAGVQVGVVDVPGHERFIKNMLAGACGIDLVLLVVASDEGVMPQTREHLDICLLLGIEKAVVAMTKTDLADPELVEAAIADVEDLLSGTPYEGCPIVRVSSATGAGLDELREALAAVVRDVRGRAAAGAFRMPVDRAFVVEGFGTIVTGTAWSGTVRRGDPVEILPSGLSSRVRSVQVHGKDVPGVGAGTRTAIALHGVEKSAVGRGDWVVSPRCFTAAHMLDVKLTLVPGVGKPLKNRTRVRFHLGSSEVFGRVVLLESEELVPGQSGLAQVRLENPAVAAKGDRFVIRSYSPARTLGGGTVIAPAVRKLRRRDQKAVQSLARQAEGRPEEDLLEVVAAAGAKAVSLDALSKQMGVERTELERVAGEQVSAGALVHAGGDRYVTAEVLSMTRSALEGWIAEYQRDHPLRWGIPKGELGSRAREAGIAGEVFETALRSLQEEGRLFARSDRLRAGSKKPELSREQRDLLREVEEAYRRAGQSPPTLKELAERLGARADRGEVLEAVEFLCMEGKLEKLTAEMAFHISALERVKELVAGYFTRHDTLPVAAFKELVGASRKFAVPLLEHLDRTGITRRVGDVRAPGRRLR